jgi:hypothetical protein
VHKNDRQETILNILRNLRNLDGLKQLFWQELNYERENSPLSPRKWPESARQPLAEDPILFATGGEDSAFHIIYCRLESEILLRGHERPVVNCLVREHPYALFIFSNQDRSDWHFLNVKYEEKADKRRLLRRISVRPGIGLRTATERLQMLDLETISPELFALSPITIQQRHDDAFDVEKVSRDFYREIANWYFWALKHVTFPKDAPKEQDGRDHVSVIRLITRLIFCWFIREKGLIPNVLFNQPKLAEMLEGFAPGETRNEDSVFYRAILQNLFFATLNTEMDQRDWKYPEQNSMMHNIYRYVGCFRDPEVALEWFKEIPFLNDGLFECLDRDFGEDAKPRYLWVDGFTDRDDCRPTVPDFLFFGSERDVDLSDEYGNKKSRGVRVRGLIDTLNRYKFTIEENTPFDQEVALDPELCGKVFENLLAAYNPETGTTARKATGSFYTPREIVDYMIDESLVTYLRRRLTESAVEVPMTALPALLAYESEAQDFSDKATAELIEAIDELKVLDPAVGSGAFPMGILHKLVHVLGKLDPDNERWKAKQIAKLDDATMREDAERLFRENYDNYGRKLYLIENCIYGVDIQPIAVQIAKMRFFISLIVDQKVDQKVPNLGVRALPNLETKFVAANTLVGIDRPAQMMLRNPDIDEKEEELRRVRERHFTAKTLKKKAKCREADKRLRSEIAELLKDDGWGNNTARQLAEWDPYDQNAHADFFDSEWMFGITDGFSIVIGNPPYLESRSPAFSDNLKEQLQGAVAARWPGIKVSDCIPRGADLLVYFLECAVHLINDSGICVLITQNAWLDTVYGKKFQDFILEKTHVSMVVDSDFKHFDSAAGPNINTVITVCLGKEPVPERYITFARFHDTMKAGYIPASGDRLTSSIEGVDFRQYPYSGQVVRRTKWGLLLSLDEVVLDLLSELEGKAVRIEEVHHCRLKVGQGLNLPKSYYVSSDLVEKMPFLQKALLPIHTADDGAPFDIRSTSMHLLNQDRLHGEELGAVRSAGVSVFDPTSTRKRPPILIMPRGIGRHFCALNSCQAFSSSGVDVYSDTTGLEQDTLYNLWAMLNSSVAWLLREATGRKNLGGGMLKAEAVDLKSLPLYIDLKATDEIKSIARQLSKRQALPTIEEIDSEEHRSLDALVFSRLSMESRKRQSIIGSLKQTIADRMSKAQT